MISGNYQEIHISGSITTSVWNVATVILSWVVLGCLCCASVPPAHGGAATEPVRPLELQCPLSGPLPGKSACADWHSLVFQS